MPRPSEAGKGPDRRPAQVSEETVALNWAIAFPPKKKDRTYTTRRPTGGSQVGTVTHTFSQHQDDLYAINPSQGHD